MYLLITFALVATVCIIMAYRDHYAYDPVWQILAVLTGIFLFICLIGIPINRASTKGDIVKFKSVQQTLATQRLRENSDIERAAIARTIAEKNEWLAETQFYARGHWLDIFYPSEILSLKPIE